MKNVQFHIHTSLLFFSLAYFKYFLLCKPIVLINFLIFVAFLVCKTSMGAKLNGHTLVAN